MHRLPFFIAAFTLFATAVYYSTPITPALLGGAAVCALIVAWFFAPQRAPVSPPFLPASRYERVALAASGILTLGILIFLSRHASTDTLLSPWQLLPDWIFVLYGLSVVSLFIGTRTDSRAGWWLFALLLFASTSVASFVYTLGYGFDGFIHRATMEVILRDGVILPRTPYYIGGYMLEIALTTLTQIRLFVIDQWFVPVATALTIPFALCVAGFRTRTALVLLAFPLSFFITTTPQSIGFLFLILAVAYATTPTKDWRTWLLATLLAAAACVAHPIAGIPTLLLICIFWMWPKYRSVAVAISVLGSLALPVIFVITQGARISWASIQTTLRGLGEGPALNPGVNMSLQFSYTYISIVLPIALAILAIYAWRTARARVMPYLLGALSCLGASLLLRCLTYRNVISYEQGAFSDRLFTITIIAVFPVLMITLTTIATTWHWDRRSRHGFALLFALITTASWYLTYPRVDVVDRSKGYSTSAADFATVAAIDRDASGTASYVVLTNQSVSAAAVAILGFHPSVSLAGTEQFIYPIPTGGPLYPYYLQMVYDTPTRAHALEAARAAGVERVYLVITPYWHNARQLNEEALVEADDTFTVGNNRVFVFQK